jgi:O-antigen/teichoic acid export membrane protein
MSIKDSPGAPAVYARVAKYFLVGVLAFVLLIQAVAPILIVLLSTREYLPAADVVSILSLGVCLSGMFNIVSVGPSVTKKTYLITVGTGVGVASNVVLNMLMIPPYGNMGAAVATRMGYAVSVAFIFIAGQRSYPIPYEFKKLGVAMLAFTACYVGAIVLGRSLGGRFVLRAAAGIAPVIVFGGALHLLGVLDLAQAATSLRRMLRPPKRER